MSRRKRALASGLPAVIEASLLEPDFKSDSKVSIRYPPLFFSGPWQVRHFWTKMVAISFVKLSGSAAAVVSALANAGSALSIGSSFILSSYSFGRLNASGISLRSPSGKTPSSNRGPAFFILCSLTGLTGCRDFTSRRLSAKSPTDEDAKTSPCDDRSHFRVDAGSGWMLDVQP